MQPSEEIFEVKRLGRDNLLLAQQLFKLFDEVFKQENPSIAPKYHLGKLLSNPAFICFVALLKGEVLGGLTAYELPMYHNVLPEIFIYDIAISTVHQRKGIGSKLLSAIQQYAFQQGIKTIFVNADEADSHALDFYSATGGREAKVVQFTYRI